jgi:hypothetical protein
MSARSEKKRRYYHHHHSKSGTKFSPAPQLLHAYFFLQDHLAKTITLDSFIDRAVGMSENLEEGRGE